MQLNDEIIRVFLTGYMGSGKSYVGKALAAKQSWGFIDLDEQISNSESKSISEIFASHGEKYFRSLELKHVMDICANESLCVIALGGGAFVQDEINQFIKDDFQSIVVYLKFSPDHLVERLENEKQDRPIIAKEKGLKKFIEDHLETRAPFYEQADIIIEDELDSNTILDLITSYLSYRS